jgi:hypothetical protein
MKKILFLVPLVFLVGCVENQSGYRYSFEACMNTWNTSNTSFSYKQRHKVAMCETYAEMQYYETRR